MKIICIVLVLFFSFGVLTSLAIETESPSDDPGVIDDTKYFTES